MTILITIGDDDILLPFNVHKVNRSVIIVSFCVLIIRHGRVDCIFYSMDLLTAVGFLC